MPKYLNFVFALSFIYVFLQILCFDNMPEYFPYTHKLGMLLHKISLSIIASYIFYFIVVHLKQKRDKLNINVFVEEEVYSIIRKHKQEIDSAEPSTVPNYGIDKTIIIEIVSIIKNIFLVMPFLDTELVKILSKILNSKYYLSVDKYYEENISKSPNDFKMYKKFHAELKKYYNLKLVQYRKGR